MNRPSTEQAPLRFMDQADMPEPGFHTGVPMDEYRNWPAVNASLLKWMRHNPAYAKHRMDSEDGQKSDAMTLGSAVHALVEGWESFQATFRIRPSHYTNAKGEEKPWHGGSNTCKAMMREWADGGYEVLKQDEFEQAQAMADAILTHPKVGQFIRRCEQEVSMLWQDELTGMWCKARMDLKTPEDVIGDIKTTRFAGAEAFGRESYRLGYHIQAGHYLNGLEALTGADVSSFVLIAVESYAPYSVAWYEVGWDALLLAKDETRHLLGRVDECTRTGTWPGYPQECQELVLPRWAGTEID